MVELRGLVMKLVVLAATLGSEAAQLLGIVMKIGAINYGIEVVQIHGLNGVLDWLRFVDTPAFEFLVL